MERFVYQGTPSRVVFEWGGLATLPAEIERLGAKRALILATPEQRALADRVGEVLGARAAGVHAQAVMHVPVEVARAARDAATALDADCCVAVGGGSTIGLGKAIALESSLPIIAVPTTYAGSEMTPIFGITEGGVKRTGRDRRVLPRAVIYDPSLTLALPPKISATSGMNALAHCVEALYAPDGNPVIALMAAEGIRALAQALPIIVQEPGNLEARGDALYGAWLAGSALGSTTMGLHHKLCHTLGGSFNLPHAEVHTIILPHATAYNRDAAPHAMRTIAAVLGVEDAAQGLYDLAERIGAPLALRDIGMSEDGLARAAALATENPYANPRPVEPAGVKQLLKDAYRGARPA